jgi:hypothetical protein
MISGKIGFVMKSKTNIKSLSDIIIYQTEDHQTKVQVRLEDDTIWLTQKQMAELFDVSIPTINEHLKNIFSTQELEENSVIRKFLITANDGKEYDLKYISDFDREMQKMLKEAKTK